MPNTIPKIIKKNISIDTENLNTTNTSITSLIDNIQTRLYDNLSWKTTAPELKRMSLLQGMPFTIFSYAAGIFRSNNRFNLFGLIDIFTYISRLNILGSLNIRNDVTFTFLNEKKILDGYLATFNNGIYGSALNIFMNSLDFDLMDGIIDKPNSIILSENNNNLIYDISYDIRCKIQPSSMASPNYYKVDSVNNKVILDELKLVKYKSIIYGGIDYEQIGIVLDSISLFPNIDDKGVDSFIYDKYVFDYYIESNYSELQNIYNIFKNADTSVWQNNYNFVDDSTILGFSNWSDYKQNIENNTGILNNKFYIHDSENMTLSERIKLYTNNDISLGFNDVFSYFCKEIYKIDYNFGQIFFLSKHKRVAKIYLMDMDFSRNIQDFNEDTIYSKKSINEKTIKIYDYSYDETKRDNYNVDLNIILMPIDIGNVDDGTIGTIDYQFLFEENIRTYNNSINQDINLNVPEFNRYHPAYSYNNNPMTFYNVPDKYLNNNFIKKPNAIHYTILSGLDDTLSFKYLENLKIYSKQSGGDVETDFYGRFSTSNIRNIMNKIFLCYYDGNNETFKKVLTSSNNTSTLDYFKGLKKVINYNSNNSFQNIEYNRKNIIDEITSFVYNINEGKAFSIDVAKNNPLSYNSGLILGIDCVILIYLTQLYYNDSNRIYSSDEIFNAYYNTINNKMLLNNDKISNFNDILQHKYSIINDIIYDNSSGASYLSLNDLSLNRNDEFFIFVSDLLKRNLNKLNQKSSYKIIEFIPNNNLDSCGNILGLDIDNVIKSDFTQVEDKWYDITYKEYYNFNSYLNNNTNNNIKQLFNDYNILSFDGSEYNTNTTKTIYESYVMMKAYSKQIFDNIIDISLIYKLFNTYNKFENLQLDLDNLTVGEFNDKINEISIDNNYLFSVTTNKLNVTYREFYVFNFFYKYSNQILSYSINNTNYNYKINYICYLKFLLMLILDSKDYYKYINHVIEDNPNTFTDSTFNDYIKLDYLPFYKSFETRHVYSLNYTFKDIFDNISYNSFIDKFTYNNTKEILIILKNIFYDTIVDFQNNFSILEQTSLNQRNTNIIGFTNDLIPYFKFINNNMQNNIIQNYGSLTIDHNIDNINNEKNKKSILVFFDNLYNIYTNLNKNFEELEKSYENTFIEITDNERVKYLKEYNKYF